MIRGLVAGNKEQDAKIKELVATVTEQDAKNKELVAIVTEQDAKIKELLANKKEQDVKIKELVADGIELKNETKYLKDCMATLYHNESLKKYRNYVKSTIGISRKL